MRGAGGVPPRGLAAEARAADGLPSSGVMAGGCWPADGRQQAEQVPVAQHPGRGIEPLRGLCDAHEGESNILMSRTALWACIGG